MTKVSEIWSLWRIYIYSLSMTSVQTFFFDDERFTGEKSQLQLFHAQFVRSENKHCPDPVEFSIT